VPVTTSSPQPPPTPLHSSPFHPHTLPFLPNSSRRRECPLASHSVINLLRPPLCTPSQASRQSFTASLTSVSNWGKYKEQRAIEGRREWCHCPPSTPQPAYYSQRYFSVIRGPSRIDNKCFIPSTYITLHLTSVPSQHGRGGGGAEVDYNGAIRAREQ